MPVNMYAIVDIETTGGPAYNCGITEVAIIIHDGEKVVERYEQLIYPERTIPHFITVLTGISDTMVEKSPVFEDVAERIYALLNGNIFVAHNAQFDFTFLNYRLKQLGMPLQVPRLCTVRMARRIFPGLPSYSLGNLCRSLEIPLSNRHRAGGDADATVKLFEKMLQHGGDEVIAQMLKRSSYEHILPLHIDKQEIAQLPYSEGVYYFHDNTGKVIYVGKAVNIRKRVLSHFSVQDSSLKRQEFVREVRKITYTVCNSELEALVFESSEINRLWPKYNRSQKKIRFRFGVYTFEDQQGFIRLALMKKMRYLQPVQEFHSLRDGKQWLALLIQDYQLPSGIFMEERDRQGRQLSERETLNARVREVVKQVTGAQQTYVVTAGANGNQTVFLVERGIYKGRLRIDNKLPDTLENLKDLLVPEKDNGYISEILRKYALLHPDRVYYYKVPAVVL